MQKQLDRAEGLLLRNDLEGAECELREVLRLDPDDAVAHNLLGVVHVGRREYPAALTAFSAAVRLRTPYVDALLNLAMACNRTGQHELALDACEQALAACPGDALALVNQGVAWRCLGRPDDAKRSFGLADPHPLARLEAGHTLLLEGDLERGLPLFEARRSLRRIGAGLRGAPWPGDSRPHETLLVVPERGPGGFLLMSRFLPALADRFARVVVHAPAALARLVAGIDTRLEVVTSLEGAHWDVWAPIMSLPLLLGVRTLDDVPTAPWIRVPATGGPAGRPRVGINWAGDPAHAWDTLRSTALDSFAPILELPDIEWVSLHRGTREFEADAFGLAQPLRHALDFQDTACVLAGLDLVISTDSAVADLAGAMGVRTCLMSAPCAHWRWNGWYPSVTLCAQQEPGNWFGPISGAAGALLEIVDAAALAAGTAGEPSARAA